MARKASLLLLSLSLSFVHSSPHHEAQVEHKEANNAADGMAEPYAASDGFSTVFSTPQGELTLKPCTFNGIEQFCWIADGTTLNIPTATVPGSVSTVSSAASDTSVAWDMTILINNNSTTTIGVPAATTGNNLTTTVLVEGASRTTLYPNTAQVQPTLTVPPLGTATATQGTGTGFVSPSGGWNTSSCVGYLCPGGPRPGWTGWSGRPRPTGGWPHPPINGTGSIGYNVSATGTGGVATSYRVTSTITSSITITNTSCCTGSSTTTSNGSVIDPVNTSSSSTVSWSNNTATANATISQPTGASFPSGPGSSNSTSPPTTGAPFPNGTATANGTVIGPTATGPRCWTSTNGTYSRISTCTGIPDTSSAWLDWNNTAQFPTGTGASRPAFTGTDSHSNSTVGPGTHTSTPTTWNSTMVPGTGASATTSRSFTINPGTGTVTTTSGNFTIGPGMGSSSTTSSNFTIGPGTGTPNTTSGNFTINPGTGSTSLPASRPSGNTGLTSLPSTYTGTHTGTHTATVSANLSKTINATAPFPVPSLNITCTSSHAASSGYSIPHGSGAHGPPWGPSPSGSPAASSDSTRPSGRTSGSSDVSATLISTPSSTAIANSSTLSSSLSYTSISRTLPVTVSPVPASSSSSGSNSDSKSFSFNATLASLSTSSSSTPSSYTPSSAPSYISPTTTTTIDRGVLQCHESIGPNGQTLGTSCRTTFETSVLATSGRSTSVSGVPGPSAGWWGDYAADGENGAGNGIGKREDEGAKEVVQRGLHVPQWREGYGEGVYGRKAVGGVGTDESHIAASDAGREDKKGGWIQQMLGRWA